MDQDKRTKQQLKARGNAFMHGLVLMSLLLLADTYLRTRSYILIDGVWDNVFLIVIAFTVVFLEMILTRAIDLEDPVCTGLASAVGIGSLGVFISQAYLIFFSEDSFFLITESVSSTGFFLITSVFGMVVAVFYFVKRIIISKKS